jgi:hypothetical protein
MFDDYDITNCFIKYYKQFDILKNIDEVVNELLIEYNLNEREIKYYTEQIEKLIINGKNGLEILDRRYVSSINIRYCFYHNGNPVWYLFTIWRN